ncbi:class I SAM-dependent methyltransferase [Pseudonocardia sp. CA-107938]|uniref:class I SAM-dependent methyltransferase n=1 Tax=Pseudonocardia sp. CA-107938 TaxID=3240021 RepID=UPI003D8FC64B
MPMNLVHRRLCSSVTWADRVERELLPWALRGVDLGDDVLEIGPGFGATTRVLARATPALTALEVDPASASGLRAEFGDTVDVVEGDGGAMPFPDGRFSAVVCFTMLHHVPSPAQQDALLREAARVLRPGGVLAGSDSRVSLLFRLLHIADTMVVVDPATLPERLTAAGFTDPEVDLSRHSLRFRAHRRRA